MRSMIATVINSRVQMHAFFSFVTSKTILCFFFIAKNATVTAYLSESSLARFKKSHLLFFFNFGVFARAQIKNETYNCFSLAACLFPLL